MVISRTVALAILATGAGTLAACGGSSSTTSSTTATAGPATTTAPAAAPTVATMSPAQIVAADAAAMRKVHSFHVAGTGRDKDGTSGLTGDVAADGNVRLELTNGKDRIQVIAIGPLTYLKANKAYWTENGGAHGSQLARLLADRWVKAPASAGSSFQSDVNKLLPKGVAYCATRSLGTLSKQGPTTVDGQQVVVLTDAGDKPGTTPGKLYIPVTGAPLPLRATQTGARTPGGHLNPRCDDKTDTTTASDLRFSNYDKPVTIVAPPGALDLEKLAQGGQTLS